jgi:ABC-type transport system involved in multi-copper enzyme maturation permease subunit
MTLQHQAPKPSNALNGFSNLFARESRKWWRTRRWWMQALIWLVILNGFAAFALFVLPGAIQFSLSETEQEAQAETEMMTTEQVQQDVPNMVFSLAAFFLPIGVIILIQNQVYAEKRSGVTAWILSKPVIRPVYLTAKLLADMAGILLIMVLAQMALAYLILSTVLEVNAVNFLAAVGLLMMLLVFYQVFTLMMSVLGNSTETIVGISLGVFLSGVILKGFVAQFLGDLIFLTPWMLPDMILLTLAGHPLPSAMYTTLIAVPVLTLICMGVMFWQFSRQEL